MVKDKKLWREIQLQYAKLQEDEVSADLFGEVLVPSIETTESKNAPDTKRSDHQGPLFYREGLRQKHWVLTCCSLMVMCEWLDRSVLSISMQSMKIDFKMNDLQVGMLASASLWVVPLATGPIGRLADRLPRAKLLGTGVLLWAMSTFATGLSGSFSTAMLCRLLAGLANCAGFPVALALLCDHFQAEELTTAMGFYHAGSNQGCKTFPNTSKLALRAVANCLPLYFISIHLPFSFFFVSNSHAAIRLCYWRLTGICCRWLIGK